jgi:MFS transporter, OFA family, oxalate/formate antiporter
MNIKTDSPMIYIYIFATIFGLGIGCWLPALSMISSTIFGMAHYASIFSVYTLIYTLGSAIGPFFAGLVYDKTGSYQIAFTIVIILFIISVIFVFPVRRPKW